MRRNTKRRMRPDEWPPIFLSAIRSGKSMSSAAEIAGVSRQNVYQRAQRDSTFAVAYAEAKEECFERLEEEAFKRLNKPDKGLGSDWLLIQMLKAVRPERYREGYVPPNVELSGPLFESFVRAMQVALDAADLDKEQHALFRRAFERELKRMEQLPEGVDETTYRDLEDDVIDVQESTKQLEA